MGCSESLCKLSKRNRRTALVVTASALRIVERIEGTMMRHLFLAALLIWAGLANSSAQQTTVFEHATVIDPDHSRPTHDATIVVRDGTIVEIAPTVRESATSRRIDLHGKFVIPALWDMHTHWADAERVFPLFIANGILGTRNMAAPEKEVFAERASTEMGQVLGPKIYACGPVLEGPEPFVANAVAIHNPDEARSTVDRLQQEGADFLKTYDGLPRDSYFAMVAEARRIGIPFEGHLPLAIRAREAIAAGQKSIEHGAVLEGTSLNEDTVEDSGAILKAIHAADRTHDFPSIPETIAKQGNLLLDGYSVHRAESLYRDMASHQTYICPTLVAERNITYIDDISKQANPLRMYALPRQLRNWEPENGFLTRYRTPAYIAFRKREYNAILKNIALAKRLGVPLLAGTDNGVAYTIPGFSLHEELELLVQAGLTPREALQTATTNPARFWNTPNGLGTLHAGSVASFVVLDADPLQTIENTRHIFAVVKDGQVLNRAFLDSLLDKAKSVAQSTH
jgi:hypothetical protein